MIFACLFCLCLLSRKWGAGVQQVYPMIGWLQKPCSDGSRESVGLVVGFWLSLDLDSELDLGLSLSLVLDYRRRLFILPVNITSFVSLHNTDLHHTFAIII